MGLSAQLAVHRTLLPALFFPRSYSFLPLYLRSFLLQLQRLWSGGRSRGLERWTLDRSGFSLCWRTLNQDKLV
ncbi:hypothetical protein DTO166G4_1781 [Paecilomyces variotii]|nr:hypothetical protein DTO166G4_1781 [Paecilomyces variotii]KAJ9223279.1 hypothetical protein DTO169C6_4325 [Paecilomyces variotii]KAJ9239537.1 hypothetical protein DTO166G5_2284 [Paecilomyces variotii]KAJ9241380.1 hypothetical protein DTO169E5_3580 [Paecilomyces variotii]KAJ9253960.1 hypothetical protein DTO207G8_3821 [Paecilomyces variotii]